MKKLMPQLYYSKTEIRSSELVSLKTRTKCSLLSLLMSVSTLAYSQDAVQTCLHKLYVEGDPSLTLLEIRQLCSEENSVNGELKEVEIHGIQENGSAPGLISNRILKEAATEFAPYVITPHNLNYILPALTTNAINGDVYADFSDGFEENLEDVEANFQVSFKVPLNHKSMLVDGDALYIGFTLEAWWQVYSSNISKPFRETNYQPELFYFAPLGWQPFGGNTGMMVGIEHQSNGRTQLTSRSWNRVFAQFLYEKDNFAFSFRPWYRLSEDDKMFAGDPEGDDNPDIEDFMGNFELGLVYDWDKVQFTYTGRQNFSTGNGSSEIGVVFPLFGKLNGYAKAFTGYGDSLIDYNYKQTRFGIGIALNKPL